MAGESSQAASSSGRGAGPLPGVRLVGILALSIGAFGAISSVFGTISLVNSGASLPSSWAQWVESFVPPILFLGTVVALVAGIGLLVQRAWGWWAAMGAAGVWSLIGAWYLGARAVTLALQAPWDQAITAGAQGVTMLAGGLAVATFLRRPDVRESLGAGSVEDLREPRSTGPSLETEAPAGLRALAVLAMGLGLSFGTKGLTSMIRVGLGPENLSFGSPGGWPFAVVMLALCLVTIGAGIGFLLAHRRSWWLGIVACCGWALFGLNFVVQGLWLTATRHPLGLLIPGLWGYAVLAGVAGTVVFLRRDLIRGYLEPPGSRGEPRQPAAGPGNVDG